MIRHCQHTFAPVLDGGARILILGSVPSVASVAQGFYYMHPHNRFWSVMSHILGCDLTQMSTIARGNALLAHHIALYDSVESCTIQGSSDAHIGDVVPADIPALLRVAPIVHIYCNGAAAYRYLVQFYPHLAPMTTSLPSTSPANARWSLSQLVEAWRIILSHLD